MVCSIASALRMRMHAIIYGIIQLYIAQWTTSSKRMSSSSSTSQRMQQATSKIFLGDAGKSIYFMTEFHASDELLYNYIIDLHHNYLITARK